MPQAIPAAAAAGMTTTQYVVTTLVAPVLVNIGLGSLGFRDAHGIEWRALVETDGEGK